MKINSSQVKLAKRILIRLRNEYSQDISKRYDNSLSDVIALLRDIEGDLKERDK